ncbi:nuclear transport factor 2 family protein [Phormidesmis sp. 146-35]
MSSSVEVVEKMYHCFKSGDMTTLKAEVFAEDLKWHLPGHHPLAGTKHGVDEVLAFFGRLRGLGLQVTPIGMGELNSGTVVEMYRATGDVNGTKLQALNCNHYTVENGKITEVQVLMANQHGYDAFFWEAYHLKPIPDRLV